MLIIDPKFKQKTSAFLERMRLSKVEKELKYIG
jgi:hypothetical protein